MLGKASLERRSMYSVYFLFQKLFSVIVRATLDLKLTYGKPLDSMSHCGVKSSALCASASVLHVHALNVGQADSTDMVDLWDVMLQISMFVKELPPSLLQSGTEDEDEMMFLSRCSEMMSSVSRKVSRPRKSHT